MLGFKEKEKIPSNDSIWKGMVEDHECEINWLKKRVDVLERLLRLRSFCSTPDNPFTAPGELDHKIDLGNGFGRELKYKMAGHEVRDIAPAKNKKGKK